MRARGSAMVEAPVVLWVLLVVLAFPLLNLTTVALRSYFVNSAVEAAALEASRARTFSQAVDGEKTAVDSAAQVVERYRSSFSNVFIDSVDTRIVAIDIASGVESVFSSKLASKADSSKNLYQIEVEVRARVSPLLSYNLAILGDIPGLTGPMGLKLKSRQFVEFPEGLNI
ncbi:hypothetical protein GC174_16380 [bacterium]|nr:hypothetical protein [bacterium]